MTNFSNRSIWTCDNLIVMRGINSHSVDLIYTNPTFFRSNSGPGAFKQGKKFKFDQTWSSYDPDSTWCDAISTSHPKLMKYLELVKHSHSQKLYSYLTYMCIRLIEMQRILKPTGSIYLHTDPKSSHYLKVAMDKIFSHQQFRNEIVWCYSGRGSNPAQKSFQAKHDIILFYSSSDSYYFDQNKARIMVNKIQENTSEHLPTDDDQLRLFSNGYFDGYVETSETHKLREDWWKVPPVSGKEGVDYLGQKPISLVDQVIQASSELGATIMDPFLGSGTTCMSAEKNSRQWIAIDSSCKAITKFQKRMMRSGITDLFEPINRLKIFDTAPTRDDHPSGLLTPSQLGCRESEV